MFTPLQFEHITTYISDYIEVGGVSLMFVCKRELCCFYQSRLGECRTVQRLYSTTLLLWPWGALTGGMHSSLWCCGMGEGERGAVSIQLWHAHY